MKAGCFAGAMHACKGWEGLASAKKHSSVLSNFGGAERGKLDKKLDKNLGKKLVRKKV
jgi:hypothetical protein